VFLSQLGLLGNSPIPRVQLLLLVQPEVKEVLGIKQVLLMFVLYHFWGQNQGENEMDFETLCSRVEKLEKEMKAIRSLFPVVLEEPKETNSIDYSSNYDFLVVLLPMTRS